MPNQNAFDHCEALVRKADKDRFLSSLFAPAERRGALFALYAFNIEITRVRDLAREPMPGEIRLQWWRDAFGAGHGDVLGNPVAAALIETVASHRLPHEAIMDLIDARTFDLYDDPMGTLADFESYAAKTSSTLIELAAQILNEGRGVANANLVTHIGIAQSMAGLLASLAVHAARRQLFIPLDLLARHGVAIEEVFAGKATPKLRTTLAEMRRDARQHLDQARELIAEAPAAVMPALLPAALVRPLLDQMERRHYDPFKPVSIPQWRHPWIIWRAARSGLGRML